ncbi:class I SAM-dependent methyltransferase [Veillonella rodentium]|uniref:O-Methyltransferase involved in polyketide biosynthesis n=1 Tax=Veillonella rodentium TaxID=248315 RepID=A0A239YZT6_9FIRM|nr:class I SAM-dependent methyltransferase [Veillonella rodentium]SNV64240.1 O-Methyltransferase involved in polyketide biosynthesis [Veillonella rodentium]
MKLDLNAVGETALLTLYARARDYESEQSVLKDKKSWDILKEIDFDFDQFKDVKMSYYGILGRAKVIDEEIRKFISLYPDCIVVSLGAGLDTMFYRVDNGYIDWYNIDFAGVIEARTHFFDPYERVHNLVSSITDDSWTGKIEINGRKLLLVSEGVVMYLSPDEMTRFLTLLTDSFSEFTLYLDMISPYVAKHTKQHDMLSKMDVSFQWGTKDGHEIVDMNPKLKQTGLINFTGSMLSLAPVVYKLLYPFIYFVNNRLGIYKYKRNM